MCRPRQSGKFGTRKTPDWLMNSDASCDLPLSQLLAASLYYPASGLDGSPIREFGLSVQSFVYADYSVSHQRASEDVESRGLRGYRVIFSKPVSGQLWPDLQISDGRPPDQVLAETS